MLRSLRRSIARALLLAAVVVVPARAQSPDHDAAYAVITGIFDAMRARDTTAMRARFVPNASMQSLGASVKFESIDGWIAGVGRAPAGVVLDERLANPIVHIDGPLANIWVDYWFFVGERFSHCGADAFLLAKQDGTWRVFSVVDTRRTQGCAPPPAR
jgi:hypothetical protein